MQVTLTIDGSELPDAVGDGVHDDTAALQAALDRCPAGGVVVLRPATTYRLTSALQITNALTLEGRGAELHQVTPATHALTVSASHVTIRALTIQGPQYAASALNLESGIHAKGASAAAPLTDLRIEACHIRTFGDYGIYLEWVTDFWVERTDVRDIYYGGIMGVSVQRGVIAHNVVSHIVGTTSANAYGICLTRYGEASLATYPRSGDVVIADNVVQDVASWEGIDAHAGERLIIRGNVVRRCRLGISVGSSVVAGVELYGSLDCVIATNIVDSGVTDGSAFNGIQLLGAGAVAGSPVERATGTIIGNVIRGHGPFNASPGGGGIMIRNTRGVVISGNTLIAPAPYGINCWYSNDAFNVSGNTILDVFADLAVVNQAVGIYLREGANSGLITGNVIGCGDRVVAAGERALTYGIRASNVTPVLPWVEASNQIAGYTGSRVIQA